MKKTVTDQPELIVLGYGTQVKVKRENLTGTIVGHLIRKNWVTYEIAHMVSGERKQTWFDEPEIEPIGHITRRKIGFKTYEGK